MTTPNEKSPAPELASEAADQRPGTENSTAESIVDARAAAGNETSSKVRREDALTDERAAEADDYPPTPESERAAFNAMMRWHLIRLLQAWRYGGDMRAVGMAAFEWARTNDVGQQAFKASENAAKLSARAASASETGAEGATGAQSDETRRVVYDIALKYCEFDKQARGYNVLRYECDDDLFNFVHEAAVALSRSPAMAAKPNQVYVEVRAAWQTGVPPVKEGKAEEFILAVRRKNSGNRVFVFAATYANQFTDDGCLEERGGGDFIADGWYRCGLDMGGEYNEVYEDVVLNEGDEIVGWHQLPQWTDSALVRAASASGTGAEGATPIHQVIHQVWDEETSSWAYVTPAYYAERQPSAPWQATQADSRDEDAYVVKRLSEALASVYTTIIGDDKVDESDGLNAIQRVERAAQVLRLEVDLYRSQAAALATRDARLTEDQWYDLASRQANANWNSDGYLAAVKALCNDYRALLTAHPGQPEPRADVTDDKQDKTTRLIKTLSDIIHDQTVAMQSAIIEWQHGNGAEAGLSWIVNTLNGPDHFPDFDAPHGKHAQFWFNANQANPLPACFCGNPSSSLWMGQGFCCDEHYHEARAKHDAASEGDAS